MNEEFTLAEAMEAVDEYLIEKSNFDRYIDKKAASEDRLENRMNKLYDISQNSPSSTVSNKSAERASDLKDILRKKQRETGVFTRRANRNEAPRPIGARYLSDVGSLSRQGNNMHTYTVAQTHEDPAHDINRSTAGETRALARSEYIAKMNKNTKGATNTKLPVQNMKAGRYLQAYNIGKGNYTEDVDYLRLQVYEAFDEGIITAEEKANMLELLNVDNYITEE